MGLKRLIPNALTVSNFLCGCIAITQIAEGELAYASFLVIVGALFDFSDGFAARMLKVESKYGAELDSLADVVSFGLVPAYLIYSILSGLTSNNSIPYLAFLIAIFSALRLAQFNTNNEQSTFFRGLPTPAGALFWISFPLIHWQHEQGIGFVDVSFLLDFLFDKITIMILVIVISYLLIARIKLLSLKFKSFTWHENNYRFLLLIFSTILMSLFIFAAIPFIILLYFIFSFIENSKNSNEV